MYATDLVSGETLKEKENRNSKKKKKRKMKKEKEERKEEYLPVHVQYDLFWWLSESEAGINNNEIFIRFSVQY